MKGMRGLWLAILFLGALAACARLETSPTPIPSPTPTPSPTSTPRPTPIPSPGPSLTYPTGADEIVVQGDTKGGFVPAIAAKMALPSFTLYGDGALLYSRWEEGGLKLLQGRLSERAIQELLHFIVVENMFFESKANYDFLWVADAATTTITVSAGGRHLRVSAYALGMEIPPGYEISAQDREQRARLALIKKRLDGLDLRGRDSPDYRDLGEYRAEGVVLLVERARPEDVPGEKAKPWTLSHIPLGASAPGYHEVGEAELEGEDARAVQGLVPLGYMSTLFSTPAQYLYYRVSYRPHLPYDWRWEPPPEPPPHITSVKPGYGATVASEDVSPGICASLSFQRGDGLGYNPGQRVRFYLDGEEVTPRLAWLTTEDLPPSSGSGCYVPRDLGLGWHVARIAYLDMAGRHFSYRWPFRVIEGRGPASLEESRRIAEGFVRSESTFRFDGIDDSLKMASSSPQSSPYAWEFVIEFESRHAGYGDRAGAILAQVITPHRARVVVQRGVVTSAVMDEVWNMLTQEYMREVRERR